MSLFSHIFRVSSVLLCTFLVVGAAPVPNDPTVKHASAQSAPHVHPSNHPVPPASIAAQPISVHSVHPKGHPEYGKHLMGVAKVSGNEHVHHMTDANMQHHAQHIANEVSHRDDQVHDIHVLHKKTHGTAHFSSTAHPHEAGKIQQTVLHAANPLSQQYHHSAIHEKISQANDHATPHTERHVTPVVGVHGAGLIGTLNVHPDMKKPGGMTEEELRTHAEWVRHNVVGDRLGKNTRADVQVSHIHGTDKVHFHVVTDPGGTIAVNAAERQKIHDHVNNHLDNNPQDNPFTPANLHGIQLNHPTATTPGLIHPTQQTYAGFLPMHPDHVSGTTPSHLAEYAKVVHQRLDAATGGRDREMVVTAHHSAEEPNFFFHTQPRGSDKNPTHALPISKGHATNDFPHIGAAYTAARAKLWPHAEIAGAMAYAIERGATDSTNYNNHLGPGYAVGVAGHTWDGPCGTCHKVLGTTTAGSYPTMGKNLGSRESNRVAHPQDDQYRGSQ